MRASAVDILPISSVAEETISGGVVYAPESWFCLPPRSPCCLGANHWLGWRFLVNVSVVTAVFGVVVIGLTIARYAAVVAHRLDQDECLDDELSTGLLLLAAGVLLLLPGLISDLLGLVLLLPATRRFIVATLHQRAASAESQAVPAWGYPRALHIEEPVAAAAEGEEAPQTLAFPTKTRAA